MRRGVAWTLGGVTFSIIGTVGAMSSYWPIYRAAAFVVMVVVVACAGAGIALIGARFRWPAAVVVAVSAGAFLVTGVPLAVPGESLLHVLPTGPGLVDLIAGVALGWKQLLTISLPVGSYEALLVPAFLVAWVIAVGTASITLRARRGEGALVLVLAAFAGGIVLGPASAGFALPSALALAAILGAWLAWLRARRRGESIVRLASPSPARPSRGRASGWVVAVAIVAASVLVGGAAATALPGTTARKVGRTGFQQPFDPRSYASPLSGYRAYLESDAISAPMLTVSGLGSQRRLAVATLDTYDGVVYSVGAASGSGTFARVPSRLAAGDGPSLTLSVQVDGYRGVWLPSAGRLQQIVFGGARAAQLSNGFFYNPVTGTAAVLSGLARGDSYRAEVTAPTVSSIAALRDATPGAGTLPKVVIPAGVDRAVQASASGARTPGQKLAAALSALRKDGYVSSGLAGEPPSASGHSAARISALFADEPMIGDAEQYSVAAALIARDLGFPARVVMGFEVPEGSSTAGRVTFTGEDVSAWVQIQTGAKGWVDVDPNPRPRPVPPKAPDTEKQVAKPQTVVPPPPDPDEQVQSDPSHSRVEPDKTPTTNALLAIVLAALPIAGIVLLVLAVLLAPFLTVIAAKWRRRRRRRRAADATGRIVGGWREFQDAALDHGHEFAPTATRTEVARVVGGGSPLVLAATADRAAFSPVSPDDAEAELVWASVDSLTRSMDEGRTRRERLRARLSLRSFGYRRGGFGALSARRRSDDQGRDGDDG